MQDYAQYLKIHPDFPKPGIVFYDLASLLSEPTRFQAMIKGLAQKAEDFDFDLILGLDARGFIYASALALQCHKGLMMARKPGKLPGPLATQTYALEYGHNTLTLQNGFIQAKQRVLIVDDVLATGGTAKVASQLVEAEGGVVAGLLFCLEINALQGRRVLQHPMASLITV